VGQRERRNTPFRAQPTPLGPSCVCTAGFGDPRSRGRVLSGGVWGEVGSAWANGVAGTHHFALNRPQQDPSACARRGLAIRRPGVEFWQGGYGERWGQRGQTGPRELTILGSFDPNGSPLVVRRGDMRSDVQGWGSAMGEGWGSHSASPRKGTEARLRLAWQNVAYARENKRKNASISEKTWQNVAQRARHMANTWL
jgi:hypothetical protein